MITLISESAAFFGRTAPLAVKALNASLE